MTMDRQFLGWHEPCLHLAARWLQQKYERDGQLDLSNVLIALPGKRAGRRLLEILTDERGLIGAPRIVTTGRLPEHLYETDPAQPHALADPLATLLARWNSLRSVDRETLEAFVPQPPDEADLNGWLALARQLNRLDDELGGEGLTVADVVPHECDDLDGRSFPEDPRWRVFEQIGKLYEENLDALGLIDRNAARIDAIRARRCVTTKNVVLIGAIDLNSIVRDMLSQVRDRVTALIHAPQEEAANFDTFGCVIAERWDTRLISIDDERIRVVDSPAEQAVEVALVLAEQQDEQQGASGEESIDATTITVGLGDETLSPAIERTLQQTSLTTHSAVGKPLTQTRPATLLAGIAAFADRLRLDDFASLLRHSDIEQYLRRKLEQHQLGAEGTEGDIENAAGLTNTIQSWLTLLDTYLSDTLHVQSVEQWLGESDREIARATQLQQVYTWVRELLPETMEIRKPLPAWSEAIAAVLRAVYADVAVDQNENEPRSHQLTSSLKVLTDALRQQAAWDGSSPLTPIIGLGDAIRFTLSRVADQAIAEQAGDGVELLGWLELQLDDAPTLIVTGFNERHIPASTHGDALLPNQLKSSLGLMHNDRRTARDAAILTAILQSRPRVTLIAGRRGGEGDPLMPSRLLLRCSPEELPTRVQRFYPEERPLRVMPIAWPCAAENHLLIPAPQPPSRPITKLNVTAFRDYLACPYRFYLKHILRLQSVDDAAVELDGAKFGNVMHDVLKAFGQDGPAHSAKLADVQPFLDQQLDDVAAKTFGNEPTATVQIQIEQIRARLHTFARWQVREVDDGWNIVGKFTEERMAAKLDVDGESIEVVGRIDRIDRRDGAYRVLDYKTGDSASSPLSAHCPGVKKRKDNDGPEPRDIDWADLQLPLYHLLVGQAKISAPTLGYVRLSKDPRVEVLATADWVQSEIDHAVEQAKDIVRDIRAGNFWPPREPGRYADEFSDLCAERYLGREAVIAASDPAILDRARQGGAR